MSGVRFTIANVFTEQMYTGNHVAVVRDGASLPDERKQEIAREIGPAAFVMSDNPRHGAYDLRVFTPAREIMYCGHPVIGAAHVIQTEMLSAPTSTMDVTMPSGPMSLRLDHRNGSAALITMRQETPVFARRYPADDLLPCLDDTTAQDLDPAFPLEEVSTGLPYVVVPIRTLAALERLTIDPNAFARIVGESDAKTMLLFAPETRDPGHDVHMRVFAHHYGIPEDPATGSAAGSLGAYLVEHEFFGSSAVNLNIEQGHSVGRPATLHVAASKSETDFTVDVGGRVVTIAKGELS